MSDGTYITLVTVVAFVVLMSAMLWLNQTICSNAAEVIGVEYQWKVFGGCFYEIDGQWIPADNYTGFEELGQ